MRFKSTVITLMCAVAWCAPARAAYVPISLSGFDYDLIVENGAAAGGALAGSATTATMESFANTGKSWYEVGYNAAAPATGLPAAGVAVVSELSADHSFRLADDYAAANAVMLDTTHNTASLTLTNPMSYSALSVLTSSGHGSGTIGYTLHYINGSTSTGSFVSNDWFGAAGTAITAAGRVDVNSGGFDSVSSTNPRLYQVDIPVAVNNSLITSVDLTFNSGSAANTRTAVFALSGVVFNPIGDVAGDIITAYNSSGSPASPANEGVANAIDNNVNTKYLNGNKTDPGYTLYTNSSISIVNSLRLTSANDAPERDPASYVIQGSKDGGATWQNISTGAVAAFSGRFVSQTLDFANTEVYGAYRLYFPTLANNATANSMQIAEALIMAQTELVDVTSHATSLTAYNASGTPNPKEPTEGIAKAFDDDPNTKYLNFNKVGAGVTLEFDKAFTVQGVGLRTANDSPDRDPASFTLQGSIDGVNFIDIVADVAVDPIATRFHNRNYVFDNDTAYLYYRIFFPTLANDAVANSMQIGEIQLFAVVPTPAALPAGLAMMTLVAMRRKR